MASLLFSPPIAALQNGKGKGKKKKKRGERRRRASTTSLSFFLLLKIKYKKNSHQWLHGHGQENPPLLPLTSVPPACSDDADSRQPSSSRVERSNKWTHTHNFLFLKLKQNRPLILGLVHFVHRCSTCWGKKKKQKKMLLAPAGATCLPRARDSLVFNLVLLSTWNILKKSFSFSLF